MADDGCGSWTQGLKPHCYAQDGTDAAAGSAIENMADAVVEAYSKAVASMGTVWIHIGTPGLTDSGAEASAISAGASAPDSGSITTVLSYAMWVSLAVAVLSLLALGGLIAARMRSGEGAVALGRVGLVLGATVLISASSALISGFMPAEPNDAGGAVLLLQSALWWYMGAAAVLSVIIGSARMAWEQRAEPGREIVRGMLTLAVVAGAGVTVSGLLVSAADSFAVWLLNGSLDCDVTADGTCFGQSMITLLDLGGADGIGAFLTILLGFIAVLAAALQVALMVARGGMLVILTGVLPLSASFTSTEMGRAWFKKCTGWLLAFILYKPAAAIVYATAFHLTDTHAFSDDGTGFLAVLTGLMLMIIALLALPALMQFVTPMVGAVAAGTGSALATGALATLPSGATAVGRLASGSRGSSDHSGLDGPSGFSAQSGSQYSQGPSGGDRTGGASQPAHSPGAPQAGRTGGVTGAGAADGGKSRTASAPTPSTSSGRSQRTRASASSTSRGAPAAGTGAGPVTAGTALDAARRPGHAAAEAEAEAAQSLAEQSTGERGGPDGSR